MIVYRFEKANGGVYGVSGLVGGAAHAAGLCWGDVMNDEDHPTPHRDPGMADAWRGLKLGTSPFYHFACESLPALCRWFYGPKGVAHLLSAGAEVVPYVVPAGTALIGRFQIAFDKRKATRLPPLSAEYVQAAADAGVSLS